MKGRIFFTALLVVVLATSFLVPYTAAQEEVDPVAAELEANEFHRQNPPFRADEAGPLSRKGGTPDTVLYFWDFEGTNGGFAGTLDWEWGTYAWAGTCATYYEPPAAYSGTDMWGTVLNECYNNLGNNAGYDTCVNGNPADDSILSFTIDLTGVTQPVEMSWWEWYDLYMNWDWGEVYANGNVVFQHCGTGYIIPTAWEEQVVDLTPYIGGLVDIEFHMMASTVVERAGWWIDNVMVYTLEPAPDLTTSYKTAPIQVEQGDPIDYTVVLSNTGLLDTVGTLMTDTIPAGTTYIPGSLSCSAGTCWEDGLAVYWNGVVPIDTMVTVDFSVDTSGADCGVQINNTAVISDPSLFLPLSVSAGTDLIGAGYYAWDFEADDGGFVPDPIGEWEWGMPDPSYPDGPPAAHSGVNVWGTDLDGDAEDGITAHLLTKTLTIPADPNGVFLQWWDWYGDEASDERQIWIDGVEVWNDNGGTDQTYWDYHTLDISAWAGQMVDLVFRLEVCCANPGPEGWYIDDVTIYGGCYVPQPNIVIDAPPLEAELCPDATETLTFTICNTGDAPLAWALSEITGTYTLAPFGPDGIGDAWETMAPLPSARVFNAVIASGPYVYVIGGTSDAGGATPTDTNFRYNTADDTWSTMAPMPAALDSIDGIAIDGQIYIPGSDPDSNTYVYDTAADAWSVIPANGGYVAPVQYQVVAIGTDLYVLGGITGGASTTNVWVLDTPTGTWSAGVPMQNSRTSFSAAAIDGNIYVAGGVLYPGFVPDMTAEMFDGAAWSYIAPVPDGGGAYTRWSYNADGMAPGALWLGAGRRDAAWAVLNHAGYYDVATDSWTDSPTIPELDQGRVYMEGDVAANGYFYVIGGRDSAGAIVYGNNERLMVYSAVFDIPWLTEVPTSGLLFPTECVTVEVTFDATDMAGGTYTATLGLESNDPDMPFTSLPVTLTVLVPPTIEFTPPALEAPTCPGGVELLDLEICNLGECTLDWFAVEVSETVELVGSAPFVPAGSATQGPVPQAPLTDSAPASAPLAVPAAPANPDAVLWDQPLSAANQSTYANQDFEALFDAYDIFIADDFGNAEWWAIDTLFVVANTWNVGCDLDCATMLNWHVYADAGGVPAGDPWGGGDPPLWAMSLPTDDPMVSFGTGTGGFQTNVTLTLDIPLYLPPATYWLVFYPSLNYVDCVCQSGRQVADTTNGNAAQVINPGGGFGYPTVWTSVQDPSTWALVQQDLAFRLEGEVLPDVPWLSLDPAAGTLEAGMCMVPEATLDSTGLLPGDYTADLLLVSNDPFVPIATVPVTFTVWAPAEVVDVSYVATYLVVDFDALVVGDEPLTFAWDFGDGNTSDLEDPTHTYAAEGCYDVTFTVTNDCASDFWSGEVCVVAECEAVDGLAFNWMPEAPLVDESVFFVATEPLTGTPPFTYTWDFGDGFGDVGQTVNHAYGAADDYEVTLMVENACGEASIMQTVTVEAGVHYIYLPIVVKNN